MSQTTGKYRPANISSSVVFYPTIYSSFRAVKGHLWTISHWKSTIYKVLGHFVEKNGKNFYEKTRIVFNSTGNYTFKVNNRNTRIRCYLCLKLTITTPVQRHRMFLLLTLSRKMPDRKWPWLIELFYDNKNCTKNFSCGFDHL